MYGTIARLRVSPGKHDELRRFGSEEVDALPSLAFQYVLQSDANPNEMWLVVGFESRDAYKTNAESPEQHERYLKFRALLDADPEWHDGEFIDAQVR
jgi:quinol monooxygenase YgiN